MILLLASSFGLVPQRRTHSGDDWIPKSSAEAEQEDDNEVK